MTTNKLKLTVLALCVASALGGAYSAGNLSAIGQANAASQPVAVTTQSTPSTPAPSAALPDLASIVERAGPAVVNISITGTKKVANRDMPFPGFGDNDLDMLLANPFSVKAAGKFRPIGKGSVIYEFDPTQ